MTAKRQAAGKQSGGGRTRGRQALVESNGRKAVDAIGAARELAGRASERRAIMKQDHRVRLTKLLLREAFLDLLVEKPVAKITVKELCEQANVNRATFYAHYRDLFDLHEEIERDLAHTIMRSLSTTLPSQSLSAFSNEICRIIVDNERSCQAIFGEHGDPEFPCAWWRPCARAASPYGASSAPTCPRQSSTACTRSWRTAASRSSARGCATTWPTAPRISPAS